MSRALPDEHYQRIALLTLAGVKNDDIAAQYGVPATTVAGWLRRARQRGLLAPTERGKKATGWPQSGFAGDERCPTCGASASRWRHDWRTDDEPKGRHAK